MCLLFGFFLPSEGTYVTFTGYKRDAGCPASQRLDSLTGKAAVIGSHTRQTFTHAQQRAQSVSIRGGYTSHLHRLPEVEDIVRRSSC